MHTAHPEQCSSYLQFGVGGLRVSGGVVIVVEVSRGKEEYLTTVGDSYGMGRIIVVILHPTRCFW